MKKRKGSLKEREQTGRQGIIEGMKGKERKGKVNEHGEMK